MNHFNFITDLTPAEFSDSNLKPYEYAEKAGFDSALFYINIMVPFQLLIFCLLLRLTFIGFNKSLSPLP